MFAMYIFGALIVVYNTFSKLILNLTLSVFFKTNTFDASIVLARPNVCAVPCMAARQRSDVAETRSDDR